MSAYLRSCCAATQLLNVGFTVSYSACVARAPEMAQKWPGEKGVYIPYVLSHRRLGLDILDKAEGQ